MAKKKRRLPEASPLSQNKQAIMRISGGTSKGIPLQIPKGNRVRPASEPSRERLFSSLGDLVQGAIFLDLFAGTGSYGLEAISRGAASGTFVEKDHGAVKCLRNNLASVCKSACLSLEAFEIAKGDVLSWKSRQTLCFDLVFVDPPYPSLEEMIPKLFAKLLREQSINEDTLVALELPGEMNLQPEGWQLHRRLGKIRKGSPSHGLFKIA
ncbi:MAG: methyltransferase [Opitutae bacterium]|nr:methyltransferase [Opitutae bacterium]